MVARRHPFQLIVLVAGFVAVIWIFSEVSLMCIALGYLVSGVIARLALLVGTADGG